MEYTNDLFSMYEAQDALESALDKVINLDDVTDEIRNLQGSIQEALETVQRILEDIRDAEI